MAWIGLYGPFQLYDSMFPKLILTKQCLIENMLKCGPQKACQDYVHGA